MTDEESTARTPTQAVAINRHCDAFETEWRAGQRPRIENYLIDTKEPLYSVTLRELLAVELECLAAVGERVDAEAYQQRFPAHTAIIAAAFRKAGLAEGSLRWEPRRQLLFGLLALQKELVDREALLVAFDCWISDPSRSLAELLRESGELDAAQEALLDAAVDAASRSSPTELGPQSSPPGSNSAPGSDSLPTTSFSASNPPKNGESSRVSEHSDSRFRVLRPHAEGGLGAVYVALDRELNREVALKEILGRHAYDPDSRQRFLIEAEFTGRLEHPGIVPVYALGAYPDGRPYYAMRFIRGESLKDAITAFHENAALQADPARRSLAFRKLLRRFIDVCNALAYAHSRGVLHRDIKPKNIMLGKYDETLVVDWGLACQFDRGDAARRSGEETLRPSSGADDSKTPELGPVGTPAFMSPEQANNDWSRIGPTCDVYSLGVTLYVILTNRAPFSGRTVHEILTNVRNGHFVPPAQVDRAVPRGLDAICRKAMAFEPRDRYASTLELADDLERWLADEPVSAYRDPWHIRLGRWGRHHKTAVAVLSALTAASIIGLSAVAAITERQNREIRRQKDLVVEEKRLVEQQKQRAEAEHTRAEANFRLAQGAVDTMLRRVGEVDLAQIPQMEAVRNDLLEKALDFSVRFLEQSRERPDLVVETARAYRAVGDIRETLGDYPGAEPSYLRAVGLLSPAGQQSRVAEKELARAEIGLGVLWKRSNRFEEARGALKAAVALRERLSRAVPEDVEARKELAESRYQLGALLADMPGRPRREADQEYKDALEILTDLSQAGGDDPGLRSSSARYVNNLAMLQANYGQRQEAETNLREAKQMLEKLVEDAPTVTEHRWRLARTLTNLAILIARTQPNEAESLQRKALALQRALAQEFPRIPQYLEEQGKIANNLALVLKASKTDEAATLYQDALTQQTKLAERFPNMPRYRQSLALTYLNLGILQESARPDAAEDCYNRAAALQRELIRLFPNVSAYHDALGRTLYSQSFLSAQPGSSKAASSLLDDAVEHHATALKANPRNDLYREHLRDALYLLAQRQCEASDLPAASTTAERLPQSLPDDPRAYYLAAEILTRCMLLVPAPRAASYLDKAATVLRAGGARGLVKDAEHRIKKIESELEKKTLHSG